MTGEFSGRTVLVTGGGRGVGRAIALLFAARRAHVIINYFHSRETAESTLREVTELGGSAELIRASVAKPDAVGDMFEQLATRHGGLDVLVNNAARGVFAPIGDVSDDDWQRAIDTNLHGARWCAQGALPLLSARPGSSVINVSSLGATMAMDNYAAVGVGKAALEALTRYLAAEFARFDIRVNAVSCPLIDNRMATLFPESDELRRVVTAATPTGRLTTETDLARVVAMLASPDAGWITGQTVIADGGLSLGRALLSPSAKPAEAPTSADVATPANVPSARAPDLRYDPVAVVGMGVKVPGADNPEELWKLLHRPEPVFTEPGERFRLADFHSDDRSTEDKTYVRRWGFIHHPAIPDEPYETTWLRHVLQQASSSTTTRPGDRHALFIGGWANGGQHLEESLVVSTFSTDLRGHYPHALAHPEDGLPDAIMRNAMSGVLPPDTSRMWVDTACSSSLYSIDLGVKRLLADEIDVAYCGGVNSWGPTYLVLFAKLRGASPSSDVRAFDRDANGTVFTDAAGMVALKRLSRARADGDEVLAVLGGFGAAADGRGAAIYAPNARGQLLAVRRARAVNNLLAHEVDLVVAHGTGTVAGDPVELESLSADVSCRPITCVSNKSLLGHPGWAAGAVSVIHALLCLRHEVVPAQQRFTELSAEGRSHAVHIPITDSPLPRNTSGRPRVAGVSSFGFGGTDAHLLVCDPHADVRSGHDADDDALVLVAWSAHLPGTPDHSTVRQRIADGLAPSPELAFGNVYPAPAFAESHLPGRTSRVIDRTQLMALAVAARFTTDNGPLWQGLEERTGVITAHRGPTRSSIESMLRCHAERVRAAVAGRPEEAACADQVETLRANVPETNEDTLPGVMPNVIGARIANRYDLRGLAMTVEAGDDTGAAALRVAGQYLRSGELDLALVLGVHGHAPPGVASLVEAKAEGAFLLALARAKTAAERGWPTLAELSPELLANATRSQTPSSGGADGLIALLAAVHAVEDAPAPKQTQRHRVVFRPAAGVPKRAPRPAIPAESLVLTATPELASALADQVRLAGGVLVVPGATAPEELEFGEHQHIRLFASFHEPELPNRVDPNLLALQEMMFLAVKRSHELLRTGSLSVVLLDPLRGGVPHPHTALFTGFVKSLVWELRDCEAFGLITTSRDINDVLRELELESSHERHLPVIQLRDGVRHAETLEPVPSTTSRLPDLPENSTIVATGGARGLTHAVVAALAQRHRPRLWILGTTDLEAIGAEAPGRRAVFIADERRRAPSRSIAEINREFDRRVSAHEAWQNIAALKEICGRDRVSYLPCDVTDPTATDAAARTITASCGQVDLFINGAGLHDATEITNKSLADFRRIRDVKVLGYHNLKSAFGDPAPLRWCNFGSIVGVVGLPGETDYAAANEMLSIAVRNDGVSEYTIGWTIWQETGMATKDVVDSFVARHPYLSLISTAEGIDHFMEELNRPRSAEDAVITTLGEKEETSLRQQFPGFLVETSGLYLRSPNFKGEDSAMWTLELHGDTNPLLSQHLVQDIPTLPGAMAIEIAAEAARTLVPGARVRVFRDALFTAFIRAPRGRLAEYTVTARMTGHSRVQVSITSDVMSGSRVLRRDRPHFQVDVILDAGDQHPERTAWTPGQEKPIANPYYADNSTVLLSGPYRNTTDHVLTAHGATSRWHPMGLPASLKRAALPVLLLDAMARATWLPRAATAGGVAVPQCFGEITLHTADNDVALAARQDVDLFAADGTCIAVSKDGAVLAEVSGVEVTPLPSPDER